MRLCSCIKPPHDDIYRLQKKLESCSAPQWKWRKGIDDEIFGYDEHPLSSTNSSTRTRDVFGSVKGMTSTCEYLDLSLRGQMDKNGHPARTRLCRAESHQYRLKFDHRPRAKQIDVLSRKIYSLNLVNNNVQVAATWPSDAFEGHSKGISLSAYFHRTRKDLCLRFLSSISEIVPLLAWRWKWV